MRETLGVTGIVLFSLSLALPVSAAEAVPIPLPAGRTGNLDLIDPATRQIVPIAGFSSQKGFVQGHGEGTTSADFGRGLIFAIDRTALKLLVLDPAAKTVVAKADLGGDPDYVRWVEATGEIWVTQPDKDR